MTAPVHSLGNVTRILSITFLVVYVITAAAVPTADANTLMAAASAAASEGRPHHQVEEGPSKRETYRKLMRSYNPIIMYHQSIRHPRFLSLLTGKDPAAEAAPRRMARRGSDYNNPSTTATVYTSGARPSWNHQILQSFFRNKQPSSLQFAKMNNKRSSSFGWNWPEESNVDENIETVLNDEYVDDQQENTDDY